MKTKSERWWRYLILIALFLAGCVIIPHHYQAAPITGQVIDKETGGPIEGVHVAVYWQYYDDSFRIYSEGEYPTKVMGVSETVTDKDGSYHIPGWEGYVIGEHYLGNESPIIGLYKQGYKFKKVDNWKKIWREENKRLYENKDVPTIMKTENGDVHLSIWDGEAIAIEKANNDVDEKVNHLRRADRFISQIRFVEGCNQKFIRKFIFAYSNEAKEIKKLIEEKYPEKYRVAPFSTYWYIDFDCGSKKR